MTPYFWLLFGLVCTILACEWRALQIVERWIGQVRWINRVRGRRAAQQEIAAQAVTTRRAQLNAVVTYPRRQV